MIWLVFLPALRRLWMRLEDSALGDLLGLLSIAVLLYAALVVGSAFDVR